MKKAVLFFLVFLWCSGISVAQKINSFPSSRIDGKFYYLEEKSRRENLLTGQTSVRGTIRFTHAPTQAELQEYESIGIAFEYNDGVMMHSATVYPAMIPFDALEKLSRMENIMYTQCSWKPMNVPPLWISRPQIQAEQVWQLTDNQKRNVTGKGILVADFDTGVDFFHPMMWFADGDTLNWVDVNADGEFTRGIDCVDLNKNGKADSTETLDYINLSFGAIGNDSAYTSDLDWLYNDANKNGVRNKGIAEGFPEASPTYGEQFFVSLDANRNNKLDAGEKLVGLKTCKVRAIRTSDGTVYRRGVNLISAPPDTGPYGGHGTAVSGILNGGIAIEKRMTGIAPDAEVIVAQIPYNAAPRFYTDLATHMTWALSEGAKIFLYEDGEWVWEFLDGSSNEEIMMNELARDNNIIHITPAGNLTGGGMMKTVTAPKQDSIQVVFTVAPGLTAVWPTFLWRGSRTDIEMQFESPAKMKGKIPFDNLRFRLDSSSIFSNMSISPRSTIRAAVELSPVDSGIWSVTLYNKTVSDKKVYCFIGDNYYSWYGYARWVQSTEDNTVTWPATADSVICIAAYDPRGKTNINGFSGRGKRLDGFASVDIACPGSTVYSIGRNNSYVAFGGTSSAGPHGAGATALLLQKFPAKKWYEIEKLIHDGAFKDSLTGNVPNTTWGWGKLRILNSILTNPTSVEADKSIPRSIVLEQNYPNPFSQTTTIKFRIRDYGLQMGTRTNQTLIPIPEPLIIFHIFDVFGREVKTINQTQHSSGENSISFNADGLASGVYYFTLEVDGQIATKKMVIIRN